MSPHAAQRSRGPRRVLRGLLSAAIALFAACPARVVPDEVWLDRAVHLLDPEWKLPGPGERAVVAEGPRAVIQFFSPGQRPLRLRLHGWLARPGKGTRPAAEGILDVRVALNGGCGAGSWRVTPDESDGVVDLSAACLRPGVNQLELELGPGKPPGTLALESFALEERGAADAVQAGQVGQAGKVGEHPAGDGEGTPKEEARPRGVGNAVGVEGARRGRGPVEGDPRTEGGGRVEGEPQNGGGVRAEAGRPGEVPVDGDPKSESGGRTGGEPQNGGGGRAEGHSQDRLLHTQARVGLQVRPVLVSAVPTFEVPLRVEGACDLETSVGLPGAGWKRAVAAARVRLVLRPAQGPERVLVERTLGPGGDGAGVWSPVRADLSAFVGQTVTLRVERTTVTSDAGAGFPLPPSADPAMFVTIEEPRLVPRLRAGGGPPPVVLVVFDTLRPDHLPVYGYARQTAPNLSALARGAVTFRTCLAQAPWTLPSIASIQTGLYPGQHQAGLRLPLTQQPAVEEEADFLAPFRTFRSVSRMSPHVRTLAERLSAAGYLCAGFVENSYLSERSGLARGFARYLWANDLRKEVEQPESRRRFFDADLPAREWLAEHAACRLFLFRHYIAPHIPYMAIPGQEHFVRAQDAPELGDYFEDEAGAATGRYDAAARRRIVDLYDESILLADRRLGDLLAALKEHGLYEQALIIVTADHGEEFWDHGGYGHGHSLFAEVLRVPLVVKWPGGAGAGLQIDEPARLIDILPTILEAAGETVPGDLPGRSLLTAAREAAGADLPGLSPGRASGGPPAGRAALAQVADKGAASGKRASSTKNATSGNGAGSSAGAASEPRAGSGVLVASSAGAAPGIGTVLGSGAAVRRGLASGNGAAMGAGAASDEAAAASAKRSASGNRAAQGAAGSSFVSFAEALLYGPPRRMVTDGRLAMIVTESRPERLIFAHRPSPAATPVLLFDLRADPGQKKDLASALPEAVTRLGARIDEWLRTTHTSAPAGGGLELSEEEIERLESLGYVQKGGPRPGSTAPPR